MSVAGHRSAELYKYNVTVENKAAVSSVDRQYRKTSQYFHADGEQRHHGTVAALTSIYNRKISTASVDKKKKCSLNLQIQIISVNHFGVYTLVSVFII